MSGWELIYGSDIKKDTSYYIPWSLEMLYQVEPELKTIAENALKAKRKRFNNRLKVYSEIKRSTTKLVGWGARDPRLRSSDAYDCFYDYILDELNL